MGTGGNPRLRGKRTSFSIEVRLLRNEDHNERELRKMKLMGNQGSRSLFVTDGKESTRL